MEVRTVEEAGMKIYTNPERILDNQYQESSF